MRPIRVIQWGLGSMGSGIARMIQKKEGIEVVGAVDVDPSKVGKELYELLNEQPTPGNQIVVRPSLEEALVGTEADIAMVATVSFMKDVFPQVESAIKNKLNVITTAEEMAYAWAADKELALRIDKLAKQEGVTVLGTGINPGFVMDLMAIMMSGVCEEVEHVSVSRVNDLSPFGMTVMKEQGIGLSPVEFSRGVENGTVAGHVGFLQSFGMFEEAFRVSFSSVTQEKEPIITSVPRSTEIVEAEPGYVSGCRQVGCAHLGNKKFINLNHPQQIQPEAENVDTGDYINIRGTPNIDLEIKPEIPGGIGTIAICVNMIPHVLNASPGLKSMLDLPIPRALVGDARNFLTESLE